MMMSLLQLEAEALAVRPFESRWAGVVAGWVRSEEELRLLAPSTPWPLTAGKVLRWQRPGGRAMVLVRNEAADIVPISGTHSRGSIVGPDEPLGYGELNRMRSRLDHWWLGHVILRPDCRGRGWGHWFAKTLICEGLEVLGAVKISLVVFPENTAAVECYLGAGFRIAGTERQQLVSGAPARKLLRMEIARDRVGRERRDPRAISVT